MPVAFFILGGMRGMFSLRIRTGFKSSNIKNFLALILMLVLSVLISLIFIGNTQTSIADKSDPIEVLGSESVNILQQTANEDPSSLQGAGANITDYEAAVLNLINTVRASNGLAGLQVNQSLVDIARTRSNDMLSRGYFSHYSPEGKTVLNIMRECGIAFSAAGENLAHSRPAGIGSPEAFLNAWMNSPTHAANILKGQYGIIGVGMTENGDRRVVTTVFRNP